MKYTCKKCWGFLDRKAFILKCLPHQSSRGLRTMKAQRIYSPSPVMLIFGTDQWTGKGDCVLTCSSPAIQVAKKKRQRIGLNMYCTAIQYGEQQFKMEYPHFFYCLQKCNSYIYFFKYRFIESQKGQSHVKTTTIYKTLKIAIK